MVQEASETPRKPKVLCVGHCHFDGPNLIRVLNREFEADVETADTGDQAFRAVRDGSFDLVLINRVFDADGGSGLDLIGRLQSDKETSGTPVMLVSNYSEAQDAAVTLGACRGFGKQALGQPAMCDCIARVFEQSRQS